MEGAPEFFAESEHAVKAGPRAVAAKSGLPRGGGRHQVGKPYQIKGKWYRPAKDPDYAAEGLASWYGEAFHGRLTANGEVYDMMHLTAAHPTLPLPSYARVTNLANGSSLVVRVNDRGPFAGGRVIDLSKRAAELLAYKHNGVTNVRIEYVGPAPLHGQDDEVLLASYRPGGTAPDPSDGLPEGVMLAMNGQGPDQPARGASAAMRWPATHQATGEAALPSVGPIVPDRPATAPATADTRTALLSYAAPQSGAGRVFAPILKGGTGEKAQKVPIPDAADGGHIHVGTWGSRVEAQRLARALAHLGEPSMEAIEAPGGQAYTLSLLPDGSADLDAMLRAAWAAGAGDAFTIR